MTETSYNRMVVLMQPAPADFDRMFGALADGTRRDIVRRALDAREGVAELARHYPMSFAAVQKHVAILERAGLVTKDRVGRRKVVRTNPEMLRAARGLLDRYEDLWRERIDRMASLVAEEPRAPGAAIHTPRTDHPGTDHPKTDHPETQEPMKPKEIDR